MYNQAQKPTRITLITGLLFATVATLTVVTLVFASDTYSASAEEVLNSNASTTSTVSPKSLNDDTISTLDVSVYSVVEVGESRDIRAIQQPEGESTIVLYRDQYIGFEPLQSIIGYYKRTTIIQLTGKTVPNAVVTLQFDATSPSTKVTTADNTGAWRIDVNINELTAGDYSATVKTSVNNVVSDTKVVGKFSVGTKRIMSNTTWMSIMIGGTTLILILVIANIIVLVTHRRERHRVSARAHRVA